jgi:hypothetical protein
MAAMAEERSLSQRLVDTASEVIVEAVKFGLDEAGARVLGPTAWNGFKRIASPVIKRLQKRFPALNFGNPDDEAAKNAAHEAALYLRKSSELRMMLFDNFDKLGKGQEEILRGINRLERVVEKTSKNVENLVDTTNEILNEIKESKHIVSQPILPTIIDMSDFVEEVYLFARIQARRSGKELDMPVFTTLLMIIAIEQFKQRVLEDGESFKTYKTSFGPHSVSMTVKGKYKGPGGKECRKYSIKQPDFVNPPNPNGSWKRVALTGTYCREEGFWRPIQ